MLLICISQQPHKCPRTCKPEASISTSSTDQIVTCTPAYLQPPSLPTVDGAAGQSEMWTFYFTFGDSLIKLSHPNQPAWCASVILEAGLKTWDSRRLSGLSRENWWEKFPLDFPVSKNFTDHLESVTICRRWQKGTCPKPVASWH